MKALTISQPFAELIACGEKWVENRTWGTAYRGPLAIHAGVGSRYLRASELRYYDRGCFVAVVEVCYVARKTHLASRSWDELLSGTGGMTVGGVLDHPYTEGPVCWILRNVRRIAKVAYTGQRGLWDVPDELIAEALAAST